AIFLSFLVLYAYQALLVKPVPKPVAGDTATRNGAAASESGAVPAQPNAPPTPVPIAATTAAPLVGATEEREVRVETRDVVALFSTRGARLTSWRQKHYLDQQKQPQELVDHELPNEPLPFSLKTPDDQVTATVNGALYEVTGVPTAPLTSAAAD